MVALLRGFAGCLTTVRLMKYGSRRSSALPYFLRRRNFWVMTLCYSIILNSDCRMQSVDELSILRAPMLKLRCSIRKTYLRGQLKTSRSQKVDFACLSKVALFLQQLRGSALSKSQSFLESGQSFLESAALEGINCRTFCYRCFRVGFREFCTFNFWQLGFARAPLKRSRICKVPLDRSQSRSYVFTVAEFTFDQSRL